MHYCTLTFLSYLGEKNSDSHASVTVIADRMTSRGFVKSLPIMQFNLNAGEGNSVLLRIGEKRLTCQSFH